GPEPSRKGQHARTYLVLPGVWFQRACHLRSPRLAYGPPRSEDPSGQIRVRPLPWTDRPGTLAHMQWDTRQKNLLLILARDVASKLATPVFLVDAEGTLVFFNEAAESVLGHTFADIGEVTAEEWVKVWQPRDVDGQPIHMRELPLGVALADGSVVVLDAGTGARPLGIHLEEDPPPRIDLLLTHLHLDHLEGLAFFAPLWWPRDRCELHIWGPASPLRSLEERVATYMSPPLFPVHLSDVPSHPLFHDVPEDEWEIGAATVSAQPISHPGPTVGYR